MFRQLSLLLVLSAGICGCQTAPEFVAKSTAIPTPQEDALRSSFSMPKPIRQEIDGMEREFIRDEIAKTPRGSQVGVYDESGGRYSGTVLRAGPDRLEMMNCLSQERIPGPDGIDQCKTSHIPFLTVETSTVTHFGMIAPPPPGFPATDDEIDGSEYSVAEIVNRSGQRQRWGRAPASAETAE